MRNQTTQPTTSKQPASWLSREWQEIKSWPDDSKVGWIFLGILLALALFLFVPGIWLKLIIGLLAFLLIDFWLVTRFIPDTPELRSWIIERGIAFIALALIVTLAFTFVLWIIVNFFWAADEALVTMEETDGLVGGVDVHVCPICMKALNVEESVLMKGAKVTTRPGLFANICAKAAVLTY